MAHPTSQHGDITLLLKNAQRGDTNASRSVFEMLVEDLRKVAHGMMTSERSGHTLQPTALVNEACLRLMKQDVVQSAENRRYLFAAANRAMQQVLVDHARTRSAMKRGGDHARHSMDTLLDNFQEKNGIAFEPLYDALEDLEKQSRRQREIVEHRFFSGFSIDQTAALMNISTATVERDWAVARARLFAAMRS